MAEDTDDNDKEDRDAAKLKEGSSDGESAKISRKVGYKRPPLEHQFKKGKSGNPSGSSKRARLRESSPEEQLAKALKKEVNKTFIYNTNGKVNKKTGLEVMAYQMYNRATKNDKSVESVLNWLKKDVPKAQESKSIVEFKRRLDHLAMKYREEHPLFVEWEAKRQAEKDRENIAKKDGEAQ